LQFKETTIDSREIYNGKVIKVRVDQVELANGRKASREIVEHSGGVVIIPVNDNGEILLVEQYRKPLDKSLLELPAGKLEPGEKPLFCARRELIEETGYEAGKMEYLFSFYTTPGFSDEMLYLFLATDLRKTEPAPDEDEIIKNHQIKEGDIPEYIRQGKIKDGKTILGLLALLRRDLHE